MLLWKDEKLTKRNSVKHPLSLSNIMEYHFVNAINNYHEKDIVLLYTYTHDVFESNITLSLYNYFANNITLCSDSDKINGDDQITL